jgi:hypothetical protein
MQANLLQSGGWFRTNIVIYGTPSRKMKVSYNEGMEEED